MATIHCNTFADLQTAVNTAAGGDIITLNAGGTYTGNLSLPKRTGVASAITIKTNASSGDLPAAGVRVDPTYVSFLATIQSTNTVPIVAAAKGAHHYTFLGIYFPAKPDGFGNLIDLGGDHGSGAVLADVCTDMVFDRCLFRGHPVAGQLRAIHVGVTRFQFINNYCDRFGSQGQQGNILALINGEGDHTITNNYFSGSTQPILYGGGSIRARVVASVVSATVSSATLSATTDLRVGQRIAFLCEGGTRRRWPKCLTVNSGTNAVTFETLDVVPDSPGEARWGVVEKNIVIARNYISHDPNIVQNGVLQPTTGVARSQIAGSFAGSATPTYAVQAKASGYTGQEARGTASAQTSSISITAGQGVRVTWSAVTNATGYYVYRTSAGVITRFTVANVLTYDDIGTGGTVVASIPASTVFVGWIGIELKQGINVHIHSNIIENTYKGSFGGECILIKCANQEGTAAFLSTEDVLVENNVCRNTWGFGTVSGSESGVTFTMDIQPRPVENLTFRNNLNYNSLNTNLGANQSALSRYFITVVNGAKNVQFIHNTTTHAGTGCFYIDTNVRGLLSGFLVRDNMLRGNTYLVGSSNGFGATGLSNATGGAYTFSYNGVATPSNTSSQVTGNNNQYAAYATWVTEFVDGAGTDTDDYALDNGSTYENDASDSTDIGCDIAALNTAITGVIAGAAAGGAGSPVVLTANLPDGTEGVAYSRSLEASGGTLPYTWSVFSGSVPTGLTLSSAGVLSGTPTTAGGFTFTARATDGAAQTGSRAFTVTIAAAVSVPVIAPLTLANATIGSPFTETLTATSGVLPYAWSVSSGALAPGLSLDVDTGAITGTPSGSSGTFTFSVVVQDAVDTVSVARTFTLTVLPSTPDALVEGRYIKENSMEGRLFRRIDPPTSADLVESGDVWIKVGPGLIPEGYLSSRSGANITWRKWPANEARVRELAVEEQAPILAKTAYDPTWTGGTPAIGNGVLDGIYSQSGKLVTARIRLVAGSTTTFGSGDWTFTLPLAADIDSAGTAFAIDANGNRYVGGLTFPTTSTIKIAVSGASTFWGSATPFTWASTDTLVITASYWTA